MLKISNELFIIYWLQTFGIAFDCFQTPVDKMCLTSKHLSKVIMKTGGIPANDWIDSRVALEAKALLKSTNMTVQQISEELNFPSQSFLGKYFKRVVGVSPKEYKRS